MLPLIGDIAAGLVSGGLNLIGDTASQSNARQAYQHRYQDTVKDLRKAGLNPALAYGQNPGGGAETPPYGDIGSDVTQGMQAAASARQAREQSQLTAAQTRLLNAQANSLTTISANRAKVSDLLPYRELRRNMSIEAQSIIDMIEQRQREATNASDVSAQLSRNELAQVSTALAKLTVPQAKAAARYFNTWLGRNELTIDKAMDIIKSVGGLISDLRSPAPRNTNNTIYLPRR